MTGANEECLSGRTPLNFLPKFTDDVAELRAAEWLDRESDDDDDKPFFQRADTATLAISDRSAGVSFFALAAPPLRPAFCARFSAGVSSGSFDDQLAELDRVSVAFETLGRHFDNMARGLTIRSPALGRVTIHRVEHPVEFFLGWGIDKKRKVNTRLTFRLST